ncbi:hypothetical protein KAR91_24980 [Candidatus Pacearchaeota archaeon]|nr:hypothetical protein [Candidatus Pacearchaeota archaeon]
MKKVELDANALKVATSRYFMEGEDWEDCTRRVADIISTAEETDRKGWKEKFHEMIYGRLFIPGGRILRNAGRVRGSLFNCYHLPIGDSIEEIGQCMKDSLILWSDGGGVGINFSPLRPEGDKILGKGGISSGLVSFVKAIDAIANTVESGGSRRAAAIAHVDITHPEVMEFINAKLVQGIISHFNLSVAVNENFLQAVEEDADWTFKFKQKNYGSVKARNVWNTIVHNMVDVAEPGLLNWDKFVKNNSYYFEPVLGTNPCISKGTLISTDDGLIPVEKLQDKEFKIVTDLRSINQSGSFLENARCWYVGKKPIFRITLSNNQSICLTENHKVFVKDGDVIIKKEVKDLEPQEVMMVQNNISPHHISTEHNLDEFKDGLLVGWMLGDGWVSDAYKDKKKNRVSIGFIVGEEEKTAKAFLKEKINQIKASWELPVGWLNSSGGAKSFEMSTSSMEVQNFFSIYGYTSNKDNKTIPDEILKQPHSFKRGFLAGLFSADGYCDTYRSEKNYRIGFSSCKKDIVEKVQIMLNEFGICSTTGSAVVKCNLNDKWYNHYNLTIGTSRDCMRFMNEIGFHLSSKKQESGFNFPTNSWRKKLTGEYWIKSIECVGEEDVYDINTDITHSLIANGILISNCGETTLGPYGVCDLGSLVLPNFITGSVNTNWVLLENTIETAVRFLDNVINVNKYTLEQIHINAHKSRRIGVGILGLAEYLFAKKLRYGTDKAIAEIERLMQFIRNAVYKASVKLSIEKGAFPQFDPIMYGKASFVRTLPASLRMDIKKHGIRNCTSMAIAPTGTISLLTNYTGSAEPLFAKAYIRNDRVGERMYVHPIYENIIKGGGEVPDWFVDAYDLKPADHFEVQCAIQKYVDGSVSKTINLPTDTTDEQLSDLLLEYIHDLKGVTVYRDGCREGQPLNKVSHEDAVKYMEAQSHTIENNLTATDVQCANGTCEI